jgi:putative tricarboxylic transport membrane protein
LQEYEEKTMPKTNKSIRALTRRSVAKGVAAAAVAAGALPAWHAARAQQTYPSRPVRFILPFGAAGVADITARLAAEKLGDKLGQRFVIENQPGPGGIAAARSVLSQPPDGYTMGLVTNGTAISAAIYKSLPFDPVKEFATISTIGAFDLVFATNAEGEFKTLEDVIKAARAQPGKLNVGTIAVGSTQNLGAELFRSLGGLDFQLVHDRFLWSDETHAVGEEDPAGRHVGPAALAVLHRRAHRRASRRCRLRGHVVERHVRSGRSAG